MVVSILTVTDVHQREVELTNEFVELRWGRGLWRRFNFYGDASERITALVVVRGENRVIFSEYGIDVLDVEISDDERFERFAEMAQNCYDAAVDYRREAS